MSETDSMGNGQHRLRLRMIILRDIGQEALVEFGFRIEFYVIHASRVVDSKVEAALTVSVANCELWTTRVRYGTHFPQTSPEILNQLNNLRIARTVQNMSQRYSWRLSHQQKKAV